MASVYIGRVSGSSGFSRLVAVKRAHPHLIDDPASERMLITEARLASRLNHANVVAVQDVEHTEDELLLIMDYVEGASLTELVEAGSKAGLPMPGRIAVRIVLDACAGLAAVHEIEGEDGRKVGFLHRDVSPQNILVGVDGTARIADFGLAKALTSSGFSQATNCSLKGKLAYLSPEVIDHGIFSVKSDLFAMGVVTWEALARQRLFRGDSEADTVRRVGLMDPPRLSRVAPELGAHLDNVVNKALEKDPARRYGAVRDFAAALEGVAGRADLIATSAEVGAYVRGVVGADLHLRREKIRDLDRESPAAARASQPIVTPPVYKASPSPVAARPEPQEVSIEISLAEIDLIEIESEQPVFTAAPTPAPAPTRVAPRKLEQVSRAVLSASPVAPPTIEVIPPAPRPAPAPAPKPVLVAAPAKVAEPPPSPAPAKVARAAKVAEPLRAAVVAPEMGTPAVSPAVEKAESSKTSGRRQAPSGQFGGRAAFVAVLFGSILAAGVFFARPWTPGAAGRVSAFWSKAGAVVTSATTSARHRLAALSAPPTPPPAMPMEKVAMPEPRRVDAPKVNTAPALPEKAADKRPAAILVSSLPDKEAAAGKPTVINVSSLPDKEAAAGKPTVINVSSLPDKEAAAGKPTVINVSSLPDKEAAAGKPTVINVSSLPDKEAVAGKPMVINVSSLPDK